MGSWHCLLSQTERDGNGVLHANFFAVLPARLPLRHQFDNADGFGIQIIADVLHNLGVADTAVLLNDERGNDAALDTVFQKRDI